MFILPSLSFTGWRKSGNLRGMENQTLLTQEQKISIENWVDASELTKFANLPDYDRLKAKRACLKNHRMSQET